MDPTAGTLNPNYVTPKDWKDITADEKIERMRDIIKDLSNSVGYSQTQIHVLRRKLKNHKHTDAGKVVEEKEIQDYDDESNSLCGVASSSLSKDFF